MQDNKKSRALYRQMHAVQFMSTSANFMYYSVSDPNHSGSSLRYTTLLIKNMHSYIIFKIYIYIILKKQLSVLGPHLHLIEN